MGNQTPDQERNCLDCGYSLLGLEHAGYNLVGMKRYRCPECGKAFNPKDPTSYLVGQPHGRPFRNGEAYLVAAIVGMIVVVAPFLVESLLGPDGKGRTTLCIGVWLEASVLLIGFVSLCIARHRYGRPFKAAMWVSGGTLAGLLLFLAGLGACMH